MDGRIKPGHDGWGKRVHLIGGGFNMLLSACHTNPGRVMTTGI